MPRTKLRRWKEKIDFETGEITSADKLYAQERRNKILIPPSMQILHRMVYGYDSIYMNYHNPGTGEARLNCEGGFGYSRDVRKMVKRGWITISRRSYSGRTSDIRTTIATITDQGRVAYEKWRKRMQHQLRK